MSSSSSSRCGGEIISSSFSKSLFFGSVSVSLYKSLQYSAHFSFVSFLFIKIFPSLLFIAVCLGCHFLLMLLTSLYTSLVLYSPANCSILLHCFSIQFCLSFLANVLTSLHILSYFSIISLDSLTLSLVSLFSFCYFLLIYLKLIPVLLILSFLKLSLAKNEMSSMCS